MNVKIKWQCQHKQSAMLANSSPTLSMPAADDVDHEMMAGQRPQGRATLRVSRHSRVRSAPYLSAMSVVARPTSLPTVAPIMSMGTNRPDDMALPAAMAANMKYQANIITRDL
jgi:hypothetical protein